MSSTETPDQILDAAAAVIIRDGVRGASMRSVAKEADVSVGLLSYHFDDKQTLMIAAFERATDTLLERAVSGDSITDDPADRLRLFIAGTFAEEFLRSDYLSLRISLWAVSRTDDDIAAVERQLYSRYADQLTIRIMAARPDLSRAEAVFRTTDIVVVQNGLWLNWARYEDVVDLERGIALCETIAFS